MKHRPVIHPPLFPRQTHRPADVSPLFCPKARVSAEGFYWNGEEVSGPLASTLAGLDYSLSLE